MRLLLAIFLGFASASGAAVQATGCFRLVADTTDSCGVYSWVNVGGGPTFTSGSSCNNSSNGANGWSHTAYSSFPAVLNAAMTASSAAGGWWVVEIYAYLSSAGAFGTGFYNGDGGSATQILRLGVGGNNIVWTNGVLGTLNGATVISTGTCYRVDWQGVSNNSRKIYLNGVQDASDTSDGSWNTFGTRVGDNPGASGFSWPGWMTNCHVQWGLGNPPNGAVIVDPANGQRSPLGYDRQRNYQGPNLVPGLRQ